MLNLGQATAVRPDGLAWSTLPVVLGMREVTSTTRDHPKAPRVRSQGADHVIERTTQRAQIRWLCLDVEDDRARGNPTVVLVPR